MEDVPAGHPTLTPLPTSKGDERTLELFTHDSTETELQYETDLLKNSAGNLRRFIERHHELDEGTHKSLLDIFHSLAVMKGDPKRVAQYVAIAKQARPIIDGIIQHDRVHKAAKAAPNHADASMVAKRDIEFEHALETISKDVSSRFPLGGRSGSKNKGMLDIERKMEYSKMQEQYEAISKHWLKRRGYQRASQTILGNLGASMRNLVEQMPGLGRREQVSAAEQIETLRNGHQHQHT